jgi:hypothetical protein
MKMMDNSADDEEQLATPVKDMNLPGHNNTESVSPEPGDYGALLAMTRPLVIAKDTALSLEAGDCRAEFALRKGEIICPDSSGQRMRGDGGLAMMREWARTNPAPEGGYDVPEESIFTLPHRRLNLKIRIHLGMS